MASKRLPHYLLNCRKRTALSQDDVAFLLGVESGTKVCRHERFIRLPLLEAALGYEVIFKKPISELFPGLFAEVEHGIQARAMVLHAKCGPVTNRRKARKKESLCSIASGKEVNPLKPL